MWRSLMFWRVFLAFGALSAGALILLGTLVSRRVEAYQLQQVESSLRKRAAFVREALTEYPPESLAEWRERTVRLALSLDTRVTFLDGDGQVLADSSENPDEMGNYADRPEIVAARQNDVGTATRSAATGARPTMYLAQKVNAEPVAYLRLAVPLDDVYAHVNDMSQLSWPIAVLTAVAALFLSLVLARRVSRPLQELADGADRLALGEYGWKVYATGHDELGQLAESFNRMSERLAEQFAHLDDDRQQLRTILSGMIEGVVALDAEQRILFANDRAAELLDFPTEAAVGRKLWEMVRHRPLQEVVRHALSTDEPSRQELHWDGNPARSLTVHAARLSGAPTRGAVLVLHDTSELRRLEQLRQEFVANVNHELKTPLSVIKACVETLLDGAVDDADHRGQFLDQIADQAERLHALILDLLSLSRIETGTEVYNFDRVPISDVVSVCIERYRARAESNQQILEAVPPGLNGEAVAWADEEAVNHILENLIDNALKYTPPSGRIRVGWRLEDKAVCFEVEDTGIGIPERDLPRIFERFYRVDKARSRALGGTGLGLSIVKHLVQAMDGTITATSHLGRGTRFLVRLPRAPAA
jgi:two-component system phosphate regulon sensor histidine kinase PhoR